MMASSDPAKTDAASQHEAVGRLIVLQEEERRRLSAFIHDDTMQVMASTYVRLQMLRRKIPASEQEAFKELEQTVQRCVQGLRSLMYLLHPVALEQDGLAVALGDYLEQAAADGGLAVAVSDHLESEPSERNRLILYRAAQEAIDNARLHG